MTLELLLTATAKEQLEFIAGFAQTSERLIVREALRKLVAKM